MKPGKTLWEELDAARVDDAVIGEAYEAAGARPRSSLQKRQRAQGRVCRKKS